MDLRLDGQSALVTGASSGIGKGIAIAFGQAGADVTVVYHRDTAAAEATAATIRASGRRAIICQADVSKPDDVARAFGAHMDAFGRLDILVNNAATSSQGLVHEIALEDWDRVLKTNLYGPFLCSAQAARLMIAANRGGRIINISSVHEEACWSGDSAYCVSKAGLRNLARTQAIELGPHGITVNVIAPGMIATEGMNKRAYEDASVREAAAKQIVARRVGVPEDIANMALFLASGAGSYCTGATHYVDGGWMLTWPAV